MPAAKRSKSETAALLIQLLMCFCVAFTELKVQASTSEAQTAMDHADMLRTNWTRDSLQEALTLYEKAALIWTSASDFKNASQATLKAADVYSVFSEYREALKRYKNAEALAGKTGDWLVEATALSEMGRLQSFTGNNELAQKQLTKALDLFKKHESDRSDIVADAHGEALTNLAEVSYAKGQWTEAQEQLKSALETFRNDRKGKARVHLLNGYVIGTLGDLDKAVLEVYRALQLYGEVKDKVGEGYALSALGLAPSLKRDETLATEFHNAAISIFHTVGDRRGEATALMAFGQMYQGLGEFSLAINQYEQALRLFEAIEFSDGMSAAACKVGKMHNLNEQPDKALQFYERCLQLSRAAGTVPFEVMALNGIAEVYVSQGRVEQALQLYQKVLKFYVATEDPRGQATTLNAFAETLLKFGQNEKALEAGRRALSLSEQSGDKGIRIDAFYNLARANLAVGSHEAAMSFIRQSLDIIEDLRANVASPDFRVSYLSGMSKHYELCVEILMQLDRLRSGQGFAAEALSMNEKGRARVLLDLINESGTTLRHMAAQPLLDREGELRGLFREQAQHRMDLQLNSKDAVDIAAIDKQIATLDIKYQQIQAQLRQKNPGLFPLEQLTLAQIQNALRESDTMLLEYALGDERSYLFAVTSNSFQYHELAPRKIIEDAARESYTLLTARQESEKKDYQSNVDAADNAYPDKGMKLSQMLLGSVAGQLGSKRLVIVTEGVLQHIPFDALPVPGAQTAQQAYLIDQHEVVVLPSVSALIAIRSARNRTSSPNKLLAVIADPVFNNSDERVQNKAGSRGIALAASDEDSGPQTPENRTRNRQLPRLAYASEEADALSAVAPRGTTLVVKGFDATRETAMSSEVGQYQILHFATHGVFDSERPEVSGIVLSLVDQNGNATNGLMPLLDIYSLDLSAQLTVLSACQTGLGKDMKGEGLIGLTHSFMSAGSNTVVASLWKVDDKATAVLMADFYESMLQKGMSPSEALRAAKLKLKKEKQWSAPYYWAGFVLQGEYTNRIEVARHQWRRTVLMLVGFLILVVAALLVLKKRKRRPFPAVTR